MHLPDVVGIVRSLLKAVVKDEISNADACTSASQAPSNSQEVSHGRVGSIIPPAWQQSKMKKLLQIELSVKSAASAVDHKISGDLDEISFLHEGTFEESMDACPP